MKEKKEISRRKMLGLLLVGLAILLVAITQYKIINAEKYPAILRAVEEDVPGIVNSNNHSQDVAQSSVKADDVERKIEEWKTKKIKYGQWIHVVYAITSEVDNGVVLPNGQPMPSSYTGDDWYYVNKDGLIERGVFSMRDVDRNVFQQSAFQNGILINFTFGDRQDGLQPYPLNIDFGFENRIKDAKKLGLEIKSSEEDKKGIPNTVFTYVEKLERPTQIGNEKALVTSIEVKGYFDKATGDFVETQTTLTLDNRQVAVSDATEIISIDVFSKAPDEILAILDGVK